MYHSGIKETLDPRDDLAVVPIDKHGTVKDTTMFIYNSVANSRWEKESKYGNMRQPRLWDNY